MTIICGDCLDEMRKMDDNSISAIVTDCPFGICFMGKNWDSRLPLEEYWREMLRILAAHKLGIKSLGIEKNPEYAEISKARLDYVKNNE